MGWPELSPEDLRLLLDSSFFGINSHPLTLVIYPSPDTVNWSPPPVVYVPSSTVEAMDFGITEKDEGISGHCQIFDFDCPLDKFAPYSLGFRIKYSATGGAVLENAYIVLEYKVINHLGNLSTAVITAADFLIPVPSGSVEQTIRYMDYGFIPSSVLSVGALVIVKIFGRDAGHVLDTLGNRLLIIEIKPKLMDVPVPPVLPM